MSLGELKCLQCGKPVRYWYQTNGCNDCKKDEIEKNSRIQSRTYIKTSDGMGGFQFHIDRPRPLEECMRDAKKLEETGNMGPDEARMLRVRIAGLKKDKERGILDESVDYQVQGHPLERDDA